MLSQQTSGVAVLTHAIVNCQSQEELTACAMQIHLVSAPHSDEERALILKVAAVGIRLDMRDIARRRAERQQASEFSNN